MASNSWPNSVTSRHRNIRRRAEAYASALYYSECTLGGISHRDAAVAEENARTLHSQWWLKGTDPNHPAINLRGPSAASEMSTSRDANSAEEVSNLTPVDMNGVEDLPINDDGVLGVVNYQDDHDEPIDDEPNAPILARDDDLGPSFGSLGNLSCSWRGSSRSATNTLITTERNRRPLVVSTRSLLLPHWLADPHTNPVITVTAPDLDTSPVITATAPVLKAEEGSSEEMLSTYSSYPNQLWKYKPHVTNAVQVTSESEADDSTIISGSLSCDSNTYNPSSNHPHEIVHPVSSFKKRNRDEFSSNLDQTYIEARINDAKAELLSRLRDEGNSAGFKAALAALEKYSLLKASANTTTKLSSSLQAHGGINIDGTWMSISPPDYPSVLGKNCEGDSLFTLGRMAFGMFEPSDLICSIQKQYNIVKRVKSKDLPLYVPKSLAEEVASESGRKYGGRLRTYNIVASFTVEHTNGAKHDENATCQDPPRVPLRGILTSYGYALPDPTDPNRVSIWFTGGTIEPANERRLGEWMDVFGAKAGHGDSPAEADEAKILASKMLLGVIHEPMDDSGVVGYHMNRPIGGHGSAYCDVVYMDGDLRVMRGNMGSIFAHRRA